MAFTVTDLQEVLHLLGEQPQLRAQFRTLLVTDSLQVLPEQVARLSTAIEQLAQAQRRTEQRLERLAEAQQRTEERLERLEATVQALAEAQQRTEERLQELVVEVRRLADWQRGEAGRREGERYEERMARRAPVLFNGGQGGPPDQPAVQPHLLQIVQQLPDLGGLTEEQDPFLADLIWWKDEHYAVVEISRHVNGHDIRRAAQRAATLEAAGVQAIGIVIGQHWGTADTRDQAIDEAVQWRVGDDLSAGYLAFCRRPA